MAFFDFIEVKYTNLKNQTYDFLRRMYNRNNETFSDSSPYGQVINVINNFWQYNILMLKRTVSNIIIDEADNKKVINNLARIGGHNPTRPISANGTIVLKVKPNTDIFNDIKGSKIKINDYTKLRNKSNGLIYTIRINKDYEYFNVDQSNNIYLNVIQGTYESQTNTGNGEINQVFTVSIPQIGNIDHFEVEVKYNNKPLTIRDNIFDMLKGEMSCFIKTGMLGGVDVYFGNNNFGFIPTEGSLIEIKYLLTDGINGIILTPQINDFQFIDNIFDMDDNNINVEDFFDVDVHKQINFASNGESVDFTKSIMPYVSRNFVLSTPNQYIYTLKRLSMFSKMNVYNTLNDKNYENDNIVYLFLVPNILNFFTGDVNYFNLPIDAFYLDEEEIEKTKTYLRKMGNVSVGTELEIIQPVISRYIMNVYIRKYKGYTNDTIKLNITTSVSDYLSTLERDDRIVKSDIISIIEDIEGVDGVNVVFISKKNEDYHKINPNSKIIYGLDPVLGDIIVERNELAIIRGGWSDRNGIFYNENINGSSNGPINIIFVGETEKNINISK